MLKFQCILCFLLLGTSLFAQNVTIKGYAPGFVGETVELFFVSDYFSNMETLITTASVDEDSSFFFQFETPSTQKVIIKSKNNTGFLLVQKNGDYDIYFPVKDNYDPYRPNGNNVEIAFFKLDSTDINYKILGFQRWMDNFLANNYFKKNLNPTDYVESLDRFKSNVEKAYKNDTSTFLKTHVKFSIAGLDNVQHAAQRNRYEKHDFYIKNTPVQYNNEAYMLYIADFYQSLMPRLSNEANQAVYEGVIQSSPTLIMLALGSEYTLINIRIREMVMIKALSEMYNSKEFPQTNIITILDSLSNRCLFKANEIIAQNLKKRITTLVPGGIAPDFALIEEGKETKTLNSFQNHHLYLHFYDPESEKSAKEIPLLIELNEIYGKHIQFVTIYKKGEALSEDATKRLATIPWDTYGLQPSNSMWEKYAINTFPQYTLIDAAGYIVSSPSLGPTTNGEYETIDRTFFYIRRAWAKENIEEEKTNRN